MSSALRKLLACCILALAAAVPAFLGAAGYKAYQSGEEEFAARLEAFDRLRAVAAFAPALEAGRDGAGSALHAKWFLGDGSLPLLTAELQSRLKSMAEAHGAVVLQASEASKIERGGATYLGDRIDVSGPPLAVSRLLGEIEASVPFLFVEKLEIRSDAAAQGDQTQEPPLFAAIEVYGAVRLTSETTGSGP